MTSSLDSQKCDARNNWTKVLHRCWSRDTFNGYSFSGDQGATILRVLSVTGRACSIGMVLNAPTAVGEDESNPRATAGYCFSPLLSFLALRRTSRRFVREV